MSGWQREWDEVQRRARAPREPRLGCSTVSHDKLGFCTYCYPLDRRHEGYVDEVMAWRLLALKRDGD